MNSGNVAIKELLSMMVDNNSNNLINIDSFSSAPLTDSSNNSLFLVNNFNFDKTIYNQLFNTNEQDITWFESNMKHSLSIVCLENSSYGSSNPFELENVARLTPGDYYFLATGNCGGATISIKVHDSDSQIAFEFDGDIDRKWKDNFIYQNLNYFEFSISDHGDGDTTIIDLNIETDSHFESNSIYSFTPIIIPKDKRLLSLDPSWFSIPTNRQLGYKLNKAEKKIPVINFSTDAVNAYNLSFLVDADTFEFKYNDVIEIATKDNRVFSFINKGEDESINTPKGQNPPSPSKALETIVFCSFGIIRLFRKVTMSRGYNGTTQLEISKVCVDCFKMGTTDCNFNMSIELFAALYDSSVYSIIETYADCITPTEVYCKRM